MFERPAGGDRALLVALDFGDGDPAQRLAEIDALATSAGADGRRHDRAGAAQRPDAALFAGKGKVEEIAARARRDRRRPRHLRPRAVRRAAAQPRAASSNAAWSTASSLILDIFAQRARSAEGKLQVELAQLKHQLTRLVGGWTHLERQKGGIGLRGPGETQLETDRRLLGKRVKSAEGAARARRGAARHAGPHARAARRCARWRWSATPTPASRRCSTR